jgi:predicted lipid-binding transport protein (Tim44 family)
MGNMVTSMGNMMDGPWGWGMMLACIVFGLLLLTALIFVTLFLGKKFFSPNRQQQLHSKKS